MDECRGLRQGDGLYVTGSGEVIGLGSIRLSGGQSLPLQTGRIAAARGCLGQGRQPGQIDRSPRRPVFVSPRAAICVYWPEVTAGIWVEQGAA